MSNDQSPPARKVIPYKKSGQRKSPFADMAFQFSGTALDVAIQQRDDEVNAPGEVSEAPAREFTDAAPATPTVTSTPPQGESSQALEEPSLEPAGPVPGPAEQAPSPSSEPAAKPQPRPRRVPARDLRPTPDRRSGPSALEAPDTGLQSFITRWKPFLTETQLGICAYVYNNSAAVGREYCFTSTAKLMAAVSKTERQVKTVLNQLIDWGFLIKGETVIKAPREQRGTFYRLEVTKS